MVIWEENEIQFKRNSNKEKIINLKSQSSFSSHYQSGGSKNGSVYLIENQVSSLIDKEREKKLDINDQRVEDQIKIIQKDAKIHKNINLYLRQENFDSVDNTDSNDQNSRESIDKNKISSNSNTIKIQTEKSKNKTFSSIKEQFFWSKAKFEVIKEKFKIAKFKVTQKENNDFDKIYDLIDTNQTEEFL